jgi:hypothetical protein
MAKIKNRSNGQHLHKKSVEYRTKMLQNFASFERFSFAGIVAQGILQYLSACYPSLVWTSFKSWDRSRLSTVSPTEEIVQSDLKSGLSELLISNSQNPDLAKFIAEKIEADLHKMRRALARNLGQIRDSCVKIYRIILKMP